MATSYQTNSLAMLGLGNAASPTIDRGIHLRWFFDWSLGFPPSGFDVYRRESGKTTCNPLCVDFLKVILDAGGLKFSYGTAIISATAVMAIRNGSRSGRAIVPASAANYTFKNAQPMRELTITEFHASGTVTFEAYDGSMPVAQVTQAATGAKATVTIRADRFDKVLIRATTAIVELYALCWLHVTDCAEGDEWVRLSHLELPRTRAEAEARLPAMPADALASLLAAYPRLERLINLVRTGVTGEQVLPLIAPGDDDVVVREFRFDPVKLLLLAAVDANVARILGLYFWDPPASAAVGVQYDYKVIGHWTSIDHAWICYRLSRGTPAAVARPTGVLVTPRTLAATGARQMGVGVKWNLPMTSSRLEPNAPILYHVLRASQKPDLSWTTAVSLTAAAPVAVTQNEGVLPAWFYIDGPLSDGMYRYTVKAVDIWGRMSPESTAVDVAIADTVPPPPPAGVTATPSMQNGPTGAVTVKWEWTPGQRAQAGDAKTFRVYCQTTELDPLSAKITSVTPSGTTSMLQTTLPSGTYSGYAGGALVNGGKQFKVVSVDGSASPVTVEVENVGGVVPMKVADEATFGRSYLKFLQDPWNAPGRFLLSRDWSDPTNWTLLSPTVSVSAADRYSQVFTGIDFGTSADAPTGRAMFGVATVDAKGNVSGISPPVTVAARHVAIVTPPPAATGEVYATRADFYGNSYYTLRLSPAETSLTYEVYRALDAALAAAAAAAGVPVSEANYNDDAYVRERLALTYENEFTKVAVMQSDGHGGVTDRDTIKGTGRNRYLYKIKAVDAAGNASAFSPALLVKLHDVTPPKAPVITKVTGGDRQITIAWAARTGLLRYEVHRTTDAVAARDPRRMDLIAELDAAAVELIDADVTARTPYYYGVIAVRQNDEGASVKSAMSRVVAGQAYDVHPPEPPVWSAVVRSASTVSLQWTSAESLSCLIKRRETTSAAYTSLGDWIDIGTYDEVLGLWSYSYEDTGASSERLYRYLLRVRNAAGNIGVSEESVTV